MKETAYNFVVSSKTYLNSQVISKRKSTKSQHIEQNERVKALVWFWIIDETLVLTSILSVCRLNEVGTC